MANISQQPKETEINYLNADAKLSCYSSKFITEIDYVIALISGISF